MACPVATTRLVAGADGDRRPAPVRAIVEPPSRYLASTSPIGSAADATVGRGRRRPRRRGRPRRRWGRSAGSSRLTSQTAGSAAIVSTVAKPSRRRSRSSNLKVRLSVVGPVSGAGPRQGRKRTASPERKPESSEYVMPRVRGAGQAVTTYSTGRVRGRRRRSWRRVAARTSSTGIAWTSASWAPTCGTHAGRLRLPRCGIGARYGLSVSTSVRSSGTMRRRLAHLRGAGERDDPGEADVGAPFDALARLVGTAGEAVEDRAGRHALGVEDGERVVPRLAGVDHERQAEPVGDADLGGERRTLVVARRVVVVVVEPALPHGHRRPVEQVGDRLDAVARLVRVQADGGVDLGEPWRPRAAPPATTPGRSRR